MVTGNSGFLGAAVGRVLLESGAVVHGTGLHRTPRACTAAHVMRLPEDVEKVVTRVRPEVVFHLAAPVNPDGPNNEARAQSAIVGGSAAMVEACSKFGARLVYVGTCAEYGALPTPYREDQRCAPSGVYGTLKHEASKQVMAASDIDWSVVRPFRSIGPGDTRSVVALAARAAIERVVFDMTDGLQVREWNHVDAVAKGVVAAGAHPGAIHQIINIGGGPRLSVRAIVDRIFALAGTDRTLVRAGVRPRRPHEVNTLFGDHRKADELWGAIAQPALDETLMRILESFASRPMVDA